MDAFEDEDEAFDYWYDDLVARYFVTSQVAPISENLLSEHTEV